MSTVNYGFRSIKDIARMLRSKLNKGEKAEIGFTLDTLDDVTGDNWEPTEWYGVVLTEMFDAWSLIIGEYAIGILWHDPIENDGISIEQSLIAFIKDEQNITVDEDYQLAIDFDEWK